MKYGLKESVIEKIGHVFTHYPEVETYEPLKKMFKYDSLI